MFIPRGRTHFLLTGILSLAEREEARGKGGEDKTPNGCRSTILKGGGRKGEEVRIGRRKLLGGAEDEDEDEKGCLDSRSCRARRCTG